MPEKIRIAVVGLGKMGLSHFSMVNAHPLADTVACDGSGFLVDVLTKNIKIPIHRDYAEMLAKVDIDAVVIATPSRLHAPMVEAALEKGLHVFCEKPFCLDWADSERLTAMAAEKGRIAQVLAEAYGPVVLRSKRATWRSQKSEGGGCLYDYAAHPLNLLNWYFGSPARVSGSVMDSVFSEGIDDEVFSTLQWDDGPTAQLSVNWSDESHRKMTSRISMIGTNGRIFADRQECQVYLRETDPKLPEYGAGWTVKYTTELTEDRWFYLRGEEYSAQLEDFITAVAEKKSAAAENDFASASATDKTMAMIIENAETGAPVGTAPRRAAPEPVQKRGWFG